MTSSLKLDYRFLFILFGAGLLFVGLTVAPIVIVRIYGHLWGAISGLIPMAICAVSFKLKPSSSGFFVIRVLAVFLIGIIVISEFVQRSP
jgi:hypothetical protein